MDLRVVKTKKAICNAFLELRTKNALEKVKVKDICDIALINKTTFYKYYQDIFALSEELENEAIDLLFTRFSAKDCLFSDPQKFLAGMPEAIDSMNELLFSLFDKRMDIGFKKIELQLRKYYYKPGQSEQEDILLTFIILGAIHTVKDLEIETNKYDNATLTKNLAEIINRLNFEKRLE